jgi:hypothetical protein
MKHRQPRRLPWALLASVFLHALLIGWVLLAAPEPGQKGKTARPIEVDLVMVAPQAPAPIQAPVPEPLPPQKPVTKQASKEPLKKKQPQAAAEPTGPVEPQTVATAPSAPVGEQADTPRQSSPFLVPRLSVVMPGLGNGSDESEAAGHTLRNGPGEEPDEEAVREYTAERAGKRINDHLGDLLAKAQRENGLVAPYFTHLQADLNAGFKGVDVKLTKRSTATMLREEVVETYTQPAERFAKTGSPLANDEQARPFAESSFGRSLERGGAPGGDVNSDRMLQAGLQSMAFTQVLKDSVARARLKTVLMLRQDGDGALAEARVIEQSGDTEFDEFVLHLSRKVVRTQGDTSENGGAPSAFGWSSVWQFTWEPPEVKVKLLRVLKQDKEPALQ